MPYMRSTSMTEEPITPAQALLAYHEAADKVCEVMRLRDEAWAAYERARDEQSRLLPQR